MKILREESYHSTPSLWPGEEEVQSPEGMADPWVQKDSVVIQLQDSGPYNNRLVVKLKDGSETIEQYQFEVLSDEYRICRPEDEDLPIIILHYVAEFGYYVEGSENGPWGQYEYLIDAAGRFQKRAQQASSPITNYFLSIVSSHVELLCVKLASESKLNDEKKRLRLYHCLDYTLQPQYRQFRPARIRSREPHWRGVCIPQSGWQRVRFHCGARASR